MRKAERVMEIAKYNPTRAETETTIRWDAEEKIAHIYTADPISTRKLDKLCAERPDTYKLVRRDANGAWYEAPAKMIKFGKPLSAAQKEAYAKKGQSLANYLADQREKKNSTDSDE